MNCQSHLYRNAEPASLARRWFLRECGVGLGAMALGQLLGTTTRAADSAQSLTNPLAPRQSHFPGKAKRVIFLFMAGGPSHLETFEPKPDLQRLHGEKLPASFGPVKTRRGVDKNRLLATKASLVFSTRPMS